MIDITHKSTTLRTAIAQATVRVSKEETIDAIVNHNVPKGNVFEMSKTAGLFAVKQTSNVIPDCHPLPIEFTSVSFEINQLEIVITMTVKTIYKTGVEVEAMHGVSVVALTIYDMVKPIDKNIEIQQIKLVKKSGGKSDWKTSNEWIKASLIVISNSITNGTKENKVTPIVVEKLRGYHVQVLDTMVIADEKEHIMTNILQQVDGHVPLLLLSGGTGLNPQDMTTDILKTLLHKEIPGIAEAMRVYGQQRTPKAMFSRSMAGYINSTLVIALPGSSVGVTESIQAIFPAVLHLVKKKSK